MATMAVCAACGSSSGSLKKCTGCKAVWYCNVTCQRAHRKVHRKECKQRESELKASRDDTGTEEAGASLGSMNISDSDDVDLFVSPPREDCPVCFLPMPHDQYQIKYMSCCGQSLCGGCLLENVRAITATNEERKADKDNTKPLLDESCPFCRKPLDLTENEELNQLKERMKLHDAGAYHVTATNYWGGKLGLPKDERKAFEMNVLAADLGSVNAMLQVSKDYKEGVIVGRDMSKSQFYLEQAAKGGHVFARHNLGIREENAGNVERAIRHYMIAAEAGLKESLDNIALLFRMGVANKVDYEKALRAFQKANDEMKSDERETFVKCLKGCN